MLRRRHTRLEQEIAAGASSSRTVEIAGGTTDGSVVAEDTTEGVQIAEDVGSQELDPPACRSTALCATGSLHLPL